MQVVRAGPDVQEDQRPEVHDRQPVGINRPVRPLRDEVVHDPQEAGGQEEADRVVSVPPLGQRILHAREQRVARRAEERDRHGQVVHDVQHRDGHDEGQVEPVGHIDMRLGPLHDRAEIDQQVDHPQDRQPQVQVPFRLGIFPPLGDPQHIAAGGQDDEELEAPEQEVGQVAPAEQRGAAGPLHHIERGGEQNVPAKRKDGRRGMDRAKPSERQIGFKVQNRKGQLKGNEGTRKKRDNAPEDSGQRKLTDDFFIIVDGQRRLTHFGCRVGCGYGGLGHCGVPNSPSFTDS